MPRGVMSCVLMKLPKTTSADFLAWVRRRLESLGWPG
jgi:hypothetical protein